MIRNRPPSKQARTVFAVLMIQPQRWRHGYDLAKSARLSSGTLYPLLIRLHQRGLLDARWEESDQPGRPPRHVYRLSAKGQRYAQGIERLSEYRQHIPASELPA
ncbi:MAG: PadR family transcriptional regulator [Gallionellaceae bacterium]|jgi:DNA-binding PadR family transcriptional regulator|nr:PadR family transcriptional regulator [Gallionellaceae bacterium]